jgi:IS30 family transposase
VRSCATKFRLTLADREEIRVGVERGESARAIARRLGRAPSTVTRELSANGGREGYRAVIAEMRAQVAAKRPKPGWYQAHPAQWQEVCELLRIRWSPQQIARRFRCDHPFEPERWVSAETIYQSIYVQGRGELRKELARCLRSGRAKRISRQPGEQARRGIAGMVMISQRPPEASDRALPGHWEGDLILGAGGKSAVATLVERATRYGMLIKIDNKTAEHVRDRITQEITRLPKELFRSLTWDQGTEMASHKRFTVETGIPVFFCDPHSPWQRGSNENWNGLVRQFLPKGQNLRNHSQEDLRPHRLSPQRPPSTNPQLDDTIRTAKPTCCAHPLTPPGATRQVTVSSQGIQPPRVGFVSSKEQLCNEAPIG